jgi:PAS domain S-box-containing protein
MMEDEARSVLEGLRALSDKIDAAVFVIDPETHEILFANNKLRKLFGKDVAGKKCYEVLQGLTEPCSFCGKKHVLGENLGKTYITEFQNILNKRWYKSISNSIRWAGGKHVLLEIGIDITKYKRSEEQARRLLEFQNKLIDTAAIWIDVLDKDGNVTLWNRAAELITGYSREEVIGHKKIWEWLYPDPEYRAQVFGKTKKIIEKGERFENFETTIRCKDGTVKIISWYSNNIVDDAGKPAGLVAIGIDITEKKRSEEEVRRLLELQNKLIDTSVVWIDFLDKDGNVTLWNRAAELITGYSREEVIGHKKIWEWLYPDPEYRAQVFGHAKGLIDIGGRSENFESTITCKDGTLKTIRWYDNSVLDEDGKPMAYIAVGIDVTEQRRMEKALQESEELFRSVVENSHDTILIVDDNFRIIYANEEAARLSGYVKDEIIGQDFRKFLDEESKKLVAENYMRRQRGEEAPAQYEFKIVRKDGEKRDVQIRSTVIRDRNGRLRTIAQLLDITERKKMDAERRKFEERLSALNFYGQNLNMAKSMDEVYRLTLDAMEKTLGFQYADILIIEGKTLNLVARRGYSKNLRLKLPLDGEKGITVRAARTGKPVYVPDVTKDNAYIEALSGVRSELAVPMKIENKVLGVLNVESRRPSAFDENDKALLEILAYHAAIAITNLKRQEKLSALNEYGRSLNMARNMNEIYKLTLRAMRKTLGFEYANIYMVDGKNLKLTTYYGYPEHPIIILPLDGEKGITVRAARAGKPVIVPDVREDEAYVPGKPGMLSELVVPIKVGKTVLGVLNVESERLAAFDKEDAKLLETLASHAATAISNLRRQEELKRLSEKIEHLMESSTKIMHAKDMHEMLKMIVETIRKFGWRRAAVSLRNEKFEEIDFVTAGLTREEAKRLREIEYSADYMRKIFDPQLERFKIGEFYYLPWSDPWIREFVADISIPSNLSADEMVDWHPQDMLYIPIRTLDGRILGYLSMDDPVDGKKPTRESLIPLEIFLHQAAIAIENAELIESLRKARGQIAEYAETLEQKVEERTRELKRAQEELLKAQRLAVIGELAGMVGHDLRNPLTSIAGAQYYLKKKLGGETNAKIMEMVDLIGKNIEYSNKIINDLLDYSREVHIEPTKTTPKAIMEEVISHIEVPANIKLIDLTEDQPTITVDVEKMKRVFINLIKNAIDAMPEGGTLTVKSRKVNGNVEILFSDTGIGMSKETLEKIWTPLFTTKAKGMGFGLAICKRFIEAHRGIISVESAPGKGTTFSVIIPIEQKIEGGEKIWVKPLESSSLTTTRT